MDKVKEYLEHRIGELTAEKETLKRTLRKIKDFHPAVEIRMVRQSGVKAVCAECEDRKWPCRTVRELNKIERLLG